MLLNFGNLVNLQKNIANLQKASLTLKRLVYLVNHPPKYLLT